MTIGRDVLEMVGRGDLTGASFRFKAVEQRWSRADGMPLREVLDANLFEVTITPRPAYPDTSFARRSLDAQTRPAGLILACAYVYTLA